MSLYIYAYINKLIYAWTLIYTIRFCILYVFAFVSISIHLSLYPCLYTYIPLSLHLSLYITYISVSHKHTHLRTCIHTYIHSQTYTCTYIHTQIHTYTHEIMRYSVYLWSFYQIRFIRTHLYILFSTTLVCRKLLLVVIELFTNLALFKLFWNLIPSLQLQTEQETPAMVLRQGINALSLLTLLVTAFKREDLHNTFWLNLK